MTWRLALLYAGVAAAAVVGIVCLLLPVPAVLVAPMMWGAGHVAQRVAMRRVRRQDALDDAAFDNLLRGDSKL